MTKKIENFNSLKDILEDIRSPEKLNHHPWTQSLFMAEALEKNPSLAEHAPGKQLLLAIAEHFREMRPATPPVDGKRLDTRWGRFGMLAAQYFAPFLYGQRYPPFLRDAWRRIDTAILRFVYDRHPDEISPEEKAPYRFIDGELDIPANSTISDWHRRGLEELTEFLMNRERILSRERSKPSPLLDTDFAPTTTKTTEIKAPSQLKRRFRRGIALAVSLLLLVSIVLAGIKSYQIYQLADSFRNDISTLQAIDPSSFDPTKLDEIGFLITRTKEDLTALQAEITPWTWLTSRLGWIPTYGGDIQQANDLLDMAASLLDSVDIVYQSAFPIWEAFSAEDQEIKATELTGLFLDSQPALLEAQTELHEAQAIRESIMLDTLSPKTKGLVTRVDPYLIMLDQSLSLSLSLPGLLGGAADGPKTYLVLVQNEDELRPTGGFITSVGKVVVFDGKLVSWNVEDSYNVDNPDAPYYAAPWQLDKFMNLPVFLFRDSNWITDYPTAAQWAEYLYALKYSYSVDGIIAIDQHVLVRFLDITGPIYLEELDTAISSKNILEVMRAQKIPPPAEERDPDWNRKQFMKPIAAAVLEKLLSGEGFSWKKALQITLELLDERHILVQLDDPALTEILVERNWDGAVRNPGGDFLMIVDSNVGYNKTNAVVSRRFSYDIDLTDPSAPESNIVVFYQNDAQGEMGEHCAQRELDKNSPWYAINRCYYNYLRLYLPQGAALLDATPHPVTREDMIMLEADIPARVDVIEWEEIENIQVFGTLFFVRMGESLETGFHFKLPSSILQPGPDGKTQTYHLKIQKQAGIQSVPVTVRVHLPNGAKVQFISPEGLQEGDNIFFNLELREDIEVEVVFTP